MNNTSLREIHESVDATSMEQFLKFIYTGQLDGLVSYCEELKYLAKKYQIQTLEEICDAVTDQVDGSQLALFPLRWKLDKGKAPLRIAYVNAIIVFKFIEYFCNILIFLQPGRGYRV